MINSKMNAIFDNLGFDSFFLLLAFGIIISVSVILTDCFMTAKRKQKSLEQILTKTTRQETIQKQGKRLTQSNQHDNTWRGI